jgi:PAS domain S-box-containing protein
METPPLAPPPTILIVDDEQPIRRTLQAILEKNGFTCHAAVDGEEGLAILRAGDYDVAFIDMHMPKLDGLGLLAAMREARLNTVPIVLTGFGEVSSAVEAMKLGAFDFLAKPPDFTELVRAAQRAVEHCRARRHGQIMEHLAAEWQITFDGCPDLIAILDSQQKCLRCNRAMAERLGVVMDQFTRFSFFEVLSNNTRPEQQALFQRTLAEGVVRTGEWHDDRLRGDFQVTMAPLRNSAGQLFGAVYIAHDITERKQAEEARGQLLLREQEARLEAEINRGRFAFLAQASTLLAGSLDYRATLSQVVKLAVPYLADWCLLDLLETDETIRRHAISSAFPRDESKEESAPVFSLDSDSSHPIALVVRQGEPLIATHIPVAQLWDALTSLPHQGRGTGAGASLPCMIVPLPGRNQTLGAFTFISAKPQHQFLPADLTLAEDLARRAASAIELARLFHDTQKHEQELRVLASQLSSAEDRERRRLALSIHDSLGQTLSVVKLNLEALLREAEEPLRASTAASRLSETLKLMDQLIDQTRSFTFDLYPAMLDDLGLVPTLRSYRQKFAAQTGIRVEVSEAGQPISLPTPVVNYLFRAIKELLHNAAKHARAKEVVLGVNWKPDRVRVVVADDGRGMETDLTANSTSQNGLGLLGIRERIASLGGKFLLESWPDRGTQVILEVPVEGPPKEPATWKD